MHFTCLLYCIAFIYEVTESLILLCDGVCVCELANVERSNLYLKLFKLVFGSVSLLANENEQMLKVTFVVITLVLVPPIKLLWRV